MLIGYEAFRSLVFYTEKPKLEMSQMEMDRIKKLVDEYLLKPGIRVTNPFLVTFQTNFFFFPFVSKVPIWSCAMKDTS